MPIRIAIIGGGAYGATAAMRLGRLGHNVTLFEQKGRLVDGATFNNQNRLHRGYHYPLEPSTVEQCRRGFQRFQEEFGDCVDQNFSNAYFIASTSALTEHDFIDFCSQMRLPWRQVPLTTHQPRVENASAAFMVEEAVYDAQTLRKLLIARLDDVGVRVLVGHNVDRIARRGTSFVLFSGVEQLDQFDAVINCSYADIARLTVQLGHDLPALRYEYTAVAIIEVPWETRTGITIVLGPYTTILPFGSSPTQHLLYHVESSRIVSDLVRLPEDWRKAETGPLQDPLTWFRHELMPRCADFVPDLRRAVPVGYLQGPRVLPPKTTSLDSRVFDIKVHEPGYLTVLSGKVGNCVEAADAVASHF